ncbi:hypothetical protein HQ576_10280 [bacterium]|nr:hypothetical protein [bacterium]
MSTEPDDRAAEPFEPARLPLWQRLTLLRGRPRRWLLNHFRRGYVEQQLAKRQGECVHCGACCQMGIRCLKLAYDGGQSQCQKYDGRRSLNCQTFPIDERDLAERDFVAPHTPCGYHFNGHNAAGQA